MSEQTHDDARQVRVAWLGTRLFVLLMATLATRGVTSDVAYYHDKLLGLGDAGLRDTLVEYPVPVVPILAVPGLIGDSLQAYTGQFIVLMLAVDALFTLYLFRSEGGRRGPATRFWLWFLPLMGPISLYRFDLLVAAIVAAAVICLASRPRLAGALVAIGTAIKIWPVAILPALLARRDGRYRVLTGFVVAGAVLGGGSLIATGGDLDRLTSPLTYQTDRGLHVESVWAAPLLLARLFGDRDVTMELAFQSWQIQDASTAIAQGALYVGMLAVLVLLVRALLNRVTAPEAIGVVVVAIIAIVMITNKTFSPQYLLWLGGAVAGALAVGAAPRLRSLVPLVLVMGVLGQIIFPVLYEYLLRPDHTLRQDVATVVLVVRNVLMLTFTALVYRIAWKATARAEVPVAA